MIQTRIFICCYSDPSFTHSRRSPDNELSFKLSIASFCRSTLYRYMHIHDNSPQAPRAFTEYPQRLRQRLAQRWPCSVHAHCACTVTGCSCREIDSTTVHESTPLLPDDCCAHETLSCTKGFELTHFYVWFTSTSKAVCWIALQRKTVATNTFQLQAAY